MARAGQLNNEKQFALQIDNKQCINHYRRLPMDDYIGAIRLWPLDWAPLGWVICDGRLLNISQYQELYALIGIRYGGDGVNNFAVPDLKGRMAIGSSNARPFASIGGTTEETVNLAQMPSHVHGVACTVKQKCQPAGGNMSQSPVNRFPGNLNLSGATMYNNQATSGAYMGSSEVAVNQNAVGQSMPHNNMATFLAMNYIICYDGIWPSRS